MLPDDQNQQFQQGQTPLQDNDDLYINPNGTLYQNEQDLNSVNALGQPSDTGYAESTYTNPNIANTPENQIASSQEYYNNTDYSQNPSNYSDYSQGAPDFTNNPEMIPGGVIHPQEQNGSARSSYDWITNYPTAGQAVQAQQGGSKKKTILFIAMLLIILVAIIAFTIFSKPKNNNSNLTNGTDDTLTQNNTPDTETQPDQETEQEITPPTPAPVEQPTPAPQPAPAPQPSLQPATPPPSQTNEQLDNLRKQKLRAISQKLTDYFNAYSQYPSYAQATDENWLNSMSIKKEDLTDPGGTDWRVKNTPTKNYFAYQPRPTNCNNSGVTCTTYTLSAVLSNGLVFQLYLVD